MSDGFADFKRLGYDGIDAVLPSRENKQMFKDMLSEYGFIYIAQIGTDGETVRQNLDSFREQMQNALEFWPVIINSHSGKDYFTRNQAEDFFGCAVEIEKEFGIDVVHETHRSRVMYNPWITEHLIDTFDELKLCCDFSHWVNVCERIIDDQLDVIEKCAYRCRHIHARVGYEQGPQVPDPRAPEYRRHLEAHEKWWDIIWRSAKERGLAYLTLTPEFGPPYYLHTLPYTNVPVADLEDISNWQAKRQKIRFEKFINRK